MSKFKKLINELNIEKLPSDVTISTMTIICKLNTTFNCENIARYINLDLNKILAVSYGDFTDSQTNRKLIQKKRTTSKPKKQKKIFYNQVSMYVKVNAKNKKPVNIKIFSNGSIQMTGCKTIENAMETLTKVFEELKEEKAIIDYNIMEVVDKPFCDNLKIIETKNIINYKIAMINSGFTIPFVMDRLKLYNLLLSDNYECVYDSNKHACVNVKYEHEEKLISIFVFEKGSILITGAQNCTQIYDAYIFINNYLLQRYDLIKKNDELTNSNIIKHLNPSSIENIEF